MSQLQILAIPGSLRAGSWNAALLRLAQERAPEGVNIEIWEGLNAIPPFSEDHEVVAPLPVEDLRQAIAEADALLVATPEYNGGPPGQLKNALDWTSRPYGLSAIVGKPAGVISASTSSFGGRWAQEDVRKALRLSGHTTSIRLEAEYWTILDEIAAAEGMSTPRFVGKLYDEVLDWHGEVRNFTSMLRVTCTLYLKMRGQRQPPQGAAIAAE